jgi:hypothetical protein
MKSNYNNKRLDEYSFDQSKYKRYDDFSILEPAPDIDLTLPDDEDDEISDFSLMEHANDMDFEE